MGNQARKVSSSSSSSFIKSVCFIVAALVLLMLCAHHHVEAFTPVSSRRHCSTLMPCASAASQQSLSFPPPQTSSFPTLHATRSVEDFNDDDDEDEEARLKRELDALERSISKNKGRFTRAVGSGRAGGRKRRPKPLATKSNNTNPWNNWLVKAGVPVLAVLLLAKSLFGGDTNQAASSPSYFYYQSTSYESRVYTGDGNMERTYKQSVRSNVPSLLEGRNLLPSQGTALQKSERATGPSQYLLRPSPDRGLDQELDAALVRVQQAMFSDWY